MNETLPAILRTEDLTDAHIQQIKDSREDEATELHLIEGVDHVVVIRPPTRSEYKRFQSQYEQKAKREAAQTALVRQSLVYPSHEAFETLLETMPGYQDAVLVAALRTVGTAPDVTTKKL